jgi:hypothetical protein
MLENIQTVGLLTLMEIVGPLLLGLAFLYGIAQWRRRTRADQVLGEQVTRELYKQGAEEERLGRE